MLGLTLREEFRGRRLKGTTIELSNDQQTGAIQIAAQKFLEITYPTHDLLKGIEAVGPNQGRPVALQINSPHGAHLLALGRWKWRSQGGYPTLTHGGLSLLEVLSPWVEINK